MKTKPEENNRGQSFPHFCLLPFFYCSPAVRSCEAATQTETSPRTGPTEQATVTLRRGKGPRRPRPSSMVDYQSYRDTKLLVARFLQQSSCSLTPEVQELINSIKTVLRSDEEHMEEAVRCASFIDQVRDSSFDWGHRGTKRTHKVTSAPAVSVVPLNIFLEGKLWMFK